MAKGGGGSLKIRKYYVSMHHVICLSPIDSVKKVLFDKREVFSGTQTDGILNISKEDLFGGTDREGGVSGNIEFKLGTQNQAVSTVLAAKYTNVSAYRGVVSAYLDNFYVGMNYYLKPVWYVVRRINATSDGSPVWQPTLVEPLPGQMNGIHILRDILVDPIVGLGISATRMGSSFDTAAQTCFNEGYGFSFHFKEGKQAEDNIKVVKAHLNCELYVDRITNKYEVKLIRNDYTVGSLLVLGSGNAYKVTNLKRTLPGELFSKVNVKFTNGETFEDANEPVEDISLSARQGGTVTKDIEMKGICDRTLARKIGLRELAEVAVQVWTGDIQCNREAETLNIGSPFVIAQSVNKYLDSDIVCRVTSMDLGTATDNKITITFVQDIFSAQELPIFVTPSSSWVSPVTNPTTVSDRIVQEAPYYVVATNQGDSFAQSVETTIGFIAVAARQPSGDSMYAGLWTGGIRRNSMNFCPYATSTNSLDKLATSIPIGNQSNFTPSSVPVGSFFQMDNEIMGVTAFSGSTLTVTRGVLDTVPETHSALAKIFAWESLNGTDSIKYTLSESVGVRLTPATPKAELAFASAPQDNYTIVGRMHLPYPPANMKVNTVSWITSVTLADLVLVWNSRNRFLQTVSLISWYSGNVTSESGITYSGELRRTDTSAILLSFTGETGLTRTFTTLVALPGSVVSITHSGTTATVTMSANHLLASGRSVKISGATDGLYNGNFVITVLTATSFSYTMSGTPALDATGTLVAQSSIYAGNVQVNLWSVNANGASFQKVTHIFNLI